jgi:hypothetical protein
MERLAAHVRRRRAGDAQRQEDLAVERAVPHGVIAVVGQPQRVVGRHVHAVRAAEDALSPRAQEVALAIEDHHRMRAAVEGVHPVLRVDADGGDVGVELLPRRQLRPAVEDLVAIGARAQDDRHRLTLLAGSPRSTRRP